MKPNTAIVILLIIFGAFAYSCNSMMQALKTPPPVEKTQAEKEEEELNAEAWRRADCLQDRRNVNLRRCEKYFGVGE